MAGGSLRERLQVFGGNVRRLRVGRGLSQEAFAELAGVTDDRFLRRIERGEVNVRFSTVCKLADALGVEPSVLMRAAQPVARRVGYPRQRRTRTG
jgi:transcriptional regulator with XRE-family HTH domain